MNADRDARELLRDLVDAYGGNFEPIADHDRFLNALEAARTYLSAHPAAPQPIPRDDRKLVPRDPNESMMLAMEQVGIHTPRIAGLSVASVGEIWRAGYDAATNEGSAQEPIAELVALGQTMGEDDAATNGDVQGDELVAELREWRDGYRQQDDTRLADVFDRAAARIEAQALEIARRKGDPVTRLHNICEGLADQRGGSPYSAEAWEAQDEAYREKCADLAASREHEENLREALRRWIGELRAGHTALIVPGYVVDALAVPDSAAEQGEAG